MDSKNNEKVICPKCGSDKVRTIVYGLLRFRSDEEREEFLKKHVSGGCVIFENSPSYYCDNCDTKF